MTESADRSEKVVREAREVATKRNLEELRARRENGELDEQDFPLENIYYINDQEDRPLTRRDLGRKALVLTAGEFQQFGYVTILLSNGQELDLFAEDFSSKPDDPDDVLVVFPEDLGDTEK